MAYRSSIRRARFLPNAPPGGRYHPSIVKSLLRGAFYAVEPDNRTLIVRQSLETQRRAQGEPTLPSTIGDERATNPFLRVEQPAVRMAAEAHAGRSLDNAVATFGELRAWKNAFQ